MKSKRRNDGKALEGLVAFVEKLSLPDGFVVEMNKRIVGDSEKNAAEFDIAISGKVGSAKMVWLIECRDRPSSRKAPVSWIEQLIGRRDRFQINKITAVSTQPFSRPARTLAAAKGIDLRHVQSLSPEEFQGWLQMPSYQFTTNVVDLKHADFLVSEELPEAVGYAAGELIGNIGSQPFLSSTKDGRVVRPSDAFRGVVDLHNMFDGLVANGPSLNVNLEVQYPDPSDRFVVQTHFGPAPIETIRFQGEIYIKERNVPLKSVFEYRDVDAASTISQTATYDSQQIGENYWALTLHKDSESGETQVMLVATKPPDGSTGNSNLKLP